jgi:hypothetical protein
MLVVKVYLHPGNKEQPEPSRLIGQATIANDLTGTQELGNYDYKLWTEHERPIAMGKVEGHPRHKNCWELLAMILKSANDEE